MLRPDPQPQPPHQAARLRRMLASTDVIAAVLALLFAGFFVVGGSFAATDSTIWFSASVGAALGSLLIVLLLAVVLYLPIRIGYRWLDRRWDSAADPDAAAAAQVIPMRRALRRWLLPSVGILLAGWIPWLLIHYPGSVDSDTITQLFQSLGLARRVDHHPWFDTAIFGWFWDLGRPFGSYNLGLFAFLLFQVVATAFAMALVLVYLARLGLPRGPRLVLTVFVAAFPTFAMSVAVMSKDTFAAIFWLPFFVLYVEALRTRGRFLMRPWIALGAVGVCIPLVLAKRPNVYVLVLCVVVLLLVVARGTRLRLLLGTGVVLVVTSVLWPHVVLPALGVAPGTGTDSLSIPLQQTARTVRQHGKDISPAQRAAIDRVLRYDGLAKAYVPRRSDSVKGRWDDEAPLSAKLAYFKVWLTQLLRYPGTYFAATANNTYEYFAPVSRLDFQSDLDLRRYIDFWVSRSFKGTTRAQVEEVALALRPPAALAPVRSAVNRATTTFTTGNLLASKALYCSWIPLLALGFALRRRNWFLALATVPLFLNLAILVAGPIALPRYMIPLIHGSVLMVGLLLVPIRWLPARLDPVAEGDRPAAVSDAHHPG
ncbi:DUF6020 family protein [Microlunatus ginsengisoli]|uniref:DUF6020 family protein n=1 Tax=Microlunatus ginsengisoli TaxID=363863 RepID=UPI0031D7FCFC